MARFTTDEVVTVLASTPERIGSITAGLAPDRLLAPPSPGEWSVNEILAHLRACADQWGGNMELLVTQEQPRLKSMRPRAWMMRTDYPELAFAPSFGLFVRQRAELLALLAAMPPDRWSRAARVSSYGPDPRSVLYFADRMAKHEEVHVVQIQQTVSAVRGGAA